MLKSYGRLVDCIPYYLTGYASSRLGLHGGFQGTTQREQNTGFYNVVGAASAHVIVFMLGEQVPKCLMLCVSLV